MSAEDFGSSGRPVRGKKAPMSPSPPIGKMRQLCVCSPRGLVHAAEAYIFLLVRRWISALNELLSTPGALCG